MSWRMNFFMSSCIFPQINLSAILFAVLVIPQWTLVCAAEITAALWGTGTKFFNFLLSPPVQLIKRTFFWMLWIYFFQLILFICPKEKGDYTSLDQFYVFSAFHEKINYQIYIILSYYSTRMHIHEYPIKSKNVRLYPCMKTYKVYLE